MSEFVCLMYHDLCPLEGSGRAGRDLSPSIRSYSVTPRQFREHVAAIGRDRWMDPAELRRPVARGEAPDPRVLLTFDDGWRGSIVEAEPILAEAGARAIVFITTGLIGHPLFVNEVMLRELSKDVFEVGAHTVTHPFLAECSSDSIRHELADSRSELEDILGRRVETLSIPNGSADARVLAIAQECGYTTVFTSEARMNSITRASQTIGRVAVRASTSADTVLKWCSGELGSAGWRSQALNLPRRLLGPQRYRRLRSWALGEQRGQDDMAQLVADHRSETASLVATS